MKKLRYLGLILGGLIILGSCVPHKKLVYIQDAEKREKLDIKEFDIDRRFMEIVQSGDELYIRVTSSDERPTNFSTIVESYQLDVTLRSYTVNESGYIRFPYLGNFSGLQNDLPAVHQLQNSDKRNGKATKTSP